MSNTTTATAPRIDFSELHARYSRAEFREFKKWARATKQGTLLVENRGRSVLVSLVVIAVFIVMALSAAVLVSAAATAPQVWWVLAIIGAFMCLASVRLIQISSFVSMSTGVRST